VLPLIIAATAVAAVPQASTVARAASTTTVSGDQKTIVLMANFRDRKLECTAQAVRDIVFTDPNDKSIDDLFRAASQGQVSLSGQALGPYDLAASANDPCDPEAWANALDQKALAAGIDPNTYARKVYVMPLAFQCPGTGTGSMIGTPTRAWVFRCDVQDVYAHEMGHTFGLGHASTPTGEYGDNSDFMGSGGTGLRLLNAPHYEDLGWRSAATIRTVTASGRYEIAPLAISETQAIAPQILKIAKPGTGEWFYLSFRRAQGLDSGLYSTYVEKVSVHKDEAGSNRTYLLATLADGASFSDATAGFSVSLVSRTPDYATVDVTVGVSTACSRSQPTLAISPAMQSGMAGQSLGYSVTLVNGDSAACPASSYSLAAAGLASGWVGTTSPGSVTVAPGASASVTLTVTSPVTASAASYPVGATASDAAVGNHSASAAATYQVAASCTKQDPTVSISPSSQSATAGTAVQYSATLLNRDSAGCAASTFNLARTVPAGWASSLSQSTVSLSPGQSAQVSVSLTPSATAGAGSYGLELRMTDSQNSARAGVGSATCTVLAAGDVQAPSAPTALAASFDSKRKRVNLSWSAATDNVGVTGYRVWRDGSVLGQSTGTWYVDGSLSAGATYTYSVTALDAAGNQSAASAAVQVVVPKSTSTKR
jgi:hypothetical protein